MEAYNSHTQSLPPLQVGETVSVQNQTGNHPLRWDKTGRIVEVHDHGQYVVRMDGSGRCSLRNRRFLRRCRPFCVDQEMPLPSPQHKTSPPHVLSPDSALKMENTKTIAPSRPTSTSTLPAPAIPQVVDDDIAHSHLTNGQNNPRDQRIVCPMTIPEVGCAVSSDAHLSPCHPMVIADKVGKVEPRRSNRHRRPPRALSPSLHGKSHSTSCRIIPGTSAAVDPRGRRGCRIFKYSMTLTMTM